MRRRNPHDDMAAPDYIPVSQDPENASSKRGSKSILPRSYNARRRLGLLAICAIVGLAMLAAVRIFQSGEGSSEEGTIVNPIHRHASHVTRLNRNFDGLFFGANFGLHKIERSHCLSKDSIKVYLQALFHCETPLAAWKRRHGDVLFCDGSSSFFLSFFDS